ncbi:MAG TPA: hypothetical protein VNO33_17730 [Kofleriaceae bacterium]|nr:hypothetical protein [Kofleriaceae bacterium]
MSERFVIVHRSYDPIQADLLGDLLRDAGVTARVTGTRSGALIGVAQNILEVHIAVPESQAGQATDFLEAYFSAETVDDEADAKSASGASPSGDPDDENEGEDDDEVMAGPQVRPLLAAGSSFLTFGVGHLYARRPATAAVLLVGQLAAMALLFTGDSWYDWTVALTALIGIVGCDVIGSVLAARAYRAGVRRGRVWQGALGAAYVGGALVVAHVLGPHLIDPTKGNPTGGWRRVQKKSPIEQVERPLERDPSFPPLTSQHPANPSANP